MYIYTYLEQNKNIKTKLPNACTITSALTKRPVTHSSACHNNR